MTEAEPDTPRTVALSYRVILGIIAIVVTVLWLAPEPVRIYDPLVPRLLIAAFASIGLFGSMFWEPLRLRLREWLAATGYLLLGWFLYMGSINGLGIDSVVSLVPMVVLVPALARSPAEVWAFGVFLVVGATLAFFGADDPVLPLPILLVLYGAIVVGLGWMSLSRSRLERALEASRQSLEYRVSERTHELAQTNERLQQEIEVRIAAEARAQQASKAKSAFLANMSHELRTPLNAIIGYAELLLEETESEEDRADLERIESSASHLLTIIQGVLDIARVESGQLELNLESVDVHEVIDEALALTRPEVERSDNEVVRECRPGIRVRADRVRLRQVLVNLISNAVKFTDAGQVRLACEDLGDHVHIRVHDTGIGMSGDTLGRAFDRFTQADESSTRVYGGAGLGLAVSRELTEAMSGTLTATSEPGVGSTFTIDLPAGSPG